MELFTDESDLIVKASRTSTGGNCVSIEWCEFEIKLSDNNRIPISQQELKEMCVKCLNMLFG